MTLSPRPPPRPLSLFLSRRYDAGSLPKLLATARALVVGSTAPLLAGDGARDGALARAVEARRRAGAFAVLQVTPDVTRMPQLAAALDASAFRAREARPPRRSRRDDEDGVEEVMSKQLILGL